MRNSRIVKYYKREKYIFINGRAIVPNILISGKPVIITLKQFKELITK